MTQTNNNVPAFPPNAGWRDDDPECRGMSLRDYFAGQALAGLVTIEVERPHFSTEAEIEEFREEVMTNRAQAAYLYADAMLKAREASR